jgi:TruD family tRNA pseudouridine synthase
MSDRPLNLGGHTRVFTSDFIVEEVWANRVCTIDSSLVSHLRDGLLIKFRREKAYLHFTLVKRDWETFRALNYLRRRLGVSLKRFGFAGMKDKRAVTAQRVSLWKGRVDALTRLRLKDIRLKDFDYAEERINLGTARGNRFTITLRDIPRKHGEINEILTRFQTLVTTYGIPNYYGPQRTSGGNVEAGQAIKDGDLKGAIAIILTKVQAYFEEGGIERIPKVFWYEKRMLRHLARYPNDFAGALRRIPKKILTLYVHAYQSHLFNEQLKDAIREHQVPDTLTIPGFTIPKMPELRTFPVTRRTYLKARDFTVLRVTDGEALIRFTLAKGEYASTLLSHLISPDEPGRYLPSDLR